MIEKFKKKLSDNGQSLKWFYDKFIRDNQNIDIKIGYSGFTAQLNGYAPINDIIKFEINKYLEE